MQTQQVIEYIVGWLKNYAQHAKMNGFVVGVSGGIDSAVVSTLCARTGMKTLVLNMPIHQAANQLQRANNHIQFLCHKFSNVTTQTIDLTRTFDTFQVASQAHHQTETKALALANTRSRLRMLTLYYYAQINHLLVTGTGNKVEDFGVGFFTKYGDGGVDISPIADLLKSQVYMLAQTLEINQEIQDAEPTDGLWEIDRTDEQQMGATYPELEWAMSVYPHHFDEKFTERQREVWAIFDKLHRAMQHKINPIPICNIPPHLL